MLLGKLLIAIDIFFKFLVLASSDKNDFRYLEAIMIYDEKNKYFFDSKWFLPRTFLVSETRNNLSKSETDFV